MNYYQMTAPCGLPCFECPGYLAAKCKGCRNENGRSGHQSEYCNVYQCIKKKEINFCYECSDFPCDHLHAYADKASELPHNTKVFNLCLIKKMGLEEWAKDKAKSVWDTYFHGKWKL